MSNRGHNQRKYLANVIGASFGMSSNGNEQIAIQFDITEAPEGDDLQSIAYLGTFTDAALEYTEKALRACGWEGDDVSEIPALAEAGQLGPVELVVVDEEYDGKVRAKVKFINKPGGGRFKFKEGSELDANAVKQFGARMRAAFRGGGSGGQRPPSRPSGNGGRRDPHPNAPGNDRGGHVTPGYGNSAPDDDLPFASCELHAEPSPIARCLRRT